MDNPYKDSLKGLEIPDPVEAFFAWCRERERIRVNRDSGLSAPWTDDPVLQRGRFLNVFREDDRGSRAVFRFVSPVKKNVPSLIHALFFARWCNRSSTLDRLHPDYLREPDFLRKILLDDMEQPWFSGVYPVESVRWNGRTWNRLETCTELFIACLDFLENRIKEARGNVRDATDGINEEFRMKNNFPIFMAVADIAWFRPDLVHPESPVPTGIGAAPYLDLLQRHLGLPDHHAAARKMIELQSACWPEARRKFTPLDIEYISCECRKYFSYKNGTKKFEGKNLFITCG